QRMIRWLPDPSRSPLTLILAHDPKTFEQLQTVLEQADVKYQIHLGAMSPAVVNQMFDLQLSSQAAFPQIAANQNNDIVPARVYLALTQQLSLPPREDSRSLPRRPANSGPRLPADRLPADRLSVNPADFTIGVLVAERHSLRTQDDQVRDFCRALQPRCQLGFFVALDDSLLAGKVDPAMQQLLEHYGMKADEPLQSFLLERLVRRSQRNALRLLENAE
ncbi:MAG: hypothetical protein Q8M16_07695, partial [Pirellulaceae bacterium]|nr:hypothetical protein [Pirellulaceae bacterium]